MDARSIYPHRRYFVNVEMDLNKDNDDPRHKLADIVLSLHVSFLSLFIKHSCIWKFLKQNLVEDHVCCDQAVYFVFFPLRTKKNPRN